MPRLSLVAIEETMSQGRYPSAYSRQYPGARDIPMGRVLDRNVVRMAKDYENYDEGGDSRYQIGNLIGSDR